MKRRTATHQLVTQRFSHVMGENGSAAFMLVYLAVPLELIDRVSSDIVLSLTSITVALFAGWAWPA